MVVKAEPDFLSRWNFDGKIINGEYPDGRMFMDCTGELYHVTFETLTHLGGMVAHDLFAQPLPDRVQDLETELYERAESLILDKLFEELSPFGHNVEPSKTFAAVTEAMRGVNLLTADYPVLTDCVNKALEILASWHFQ
jgi:hypothetical protein